MDKNNRNQDKKNNRTGIIICLLVALGTFLVFSFMNSQVKNATNKEISYDQFLQMLEDGNVKSVTITSNELEIVPQTQQNSLYQMTYYTGLITMDTQLVDRLDKAGVKFSRDTSDSTSGIGYMLLTTLLPILLLWGGLFFLLCQRALVA